MSNKERTPTLGKLPGSELVAVPLKIHEGANGRGYNVLSSNLNSEIERGGKKNTHHWVLDFLKSPFCSKKPLKM